MFSWINLLLKDGSAIAPNTMSANLAVRILRAAVAEGGDRRAMLSAMGLDETRLRNPFSRISAPVAIRFFKMLQVHFNDPAVHCGSVRSSDARIFQTSDCHAFGNGLGSVINAHIHIQALRQTMVKTQFDISGKPPYFFVGMPRGPDPRICNLHRISVATYARMARRFWASRHCCTRCIFSTDPNLRLPDMRPSLAVLSNLAWRRTRMEIAGRQVFRPSPFANKALLETAVARYRRPAEWMAQGKTHLAFSYFYLTSELDTITADTRPSGGIFWHERTQLAAKIAGGRHAVPRAA